MFSIKTVCIKTLATLFCYYRLLTGSLDENGNPFDLVSSNIHNVSYRLGHRKLDLNTEKIFLAQYY